MKPSEVLRAAHKSIERPENWVKHTFGFGRLRGIATTAQDCGCAVGACRAVFNGYGGAIRYLNRDAQRYGFKDAVTANDADTTTHKQVLRAFDRAIKAAEAAGK